MKHSKGFTVIEIIAVIVFLGIATTILFMQKNSISAAHRDDQRKTAINAIYYSLEEVFYPTNQYYPVTVTKDTVKAIDPTLLTDPNGMTIGSKESNYRYEGLNCDNEKCRGYSLRADLEKEADFVKSNRSH